MAVYAGVGGGGRVGAVDRGRARAATAHVHALHSPALRRR